MQNLFKIANIIFTLSICLTIFACSRMTQENFDKVKNDMTSKEVIAILGEPTSSESISIAGVSGTALTWKNSQTEITMQFLNDKLIVKTLNKTAAKDALSKE